VAYSPTSYATYAQYVALTGDTTSDKSRVEALLVEQSAMLRATAGISTSSALSDDAKLLAEKLVVSSVRRAIAPRVMTGLGDMSDVSQASWSADGFSASAQFANPSGDMYFDRQTLKAFLRAIGHTQLSVIPAAYGRLG